MARDGGLRLKARDAEDMGVLAAVLQDALVPLIDVTFQKAQKRFVMVANRFMWESLKADRPQAQPVPVGQPGSEGDAAFEDEAPEPRFQRVNCGLRFDHVANVRVRAIDMKQRDQILNLLTLARDPDGLTLLFSEDAAIRLVGRRIEAHLEDLGEPWPTDWRPAHRLDETDQPD